MSTSFHFKALAIHYPSIFCENSTVIKEYPHTAHNVWHPFVDIQYSTSVLYVRTRLDIWREDRCQNCGSTIGSPWCRVTDCSSQISTTITNTTCEPFSRPSFEAIYYQYISVRRAESTITAVSCRGPGRESAWTTPPSYPYLKQGPR